MHELRLLAWASSFLFDFLSPSLCLNSSTINTLHVLGLVVTCLTPVCNISLLFDMEKFVTHSSS